MTATAAGLVVSASAYETMDFANGVWAGSFLLNQESYDNFECAKPKINAWVQGKLDWIEPMTQMMHVADNCTVTNPSMDLAFQFFRSIVTLHYTFFGDYEGGEFC